MFFNQGQLHTSKEHKIYTRPLKKYGIDINKQVSAKKLFKKIKHTV